MSTERATKIMCETAIARNSAGEFQTRDFYLACFLRCTGYELLDLKAEGRRRVFVFRDRPERREEIIRYYGDGGSVRPLAFTTAIKEMKALIHNV